MQIRNYHREGGVGFKRKEKTHNPTVKLAYYNRKPARSKTQIIVTVKRLTISQ